MKRFSSLKWSTVNSSTTGMSTQTYNDDDEKRQRAMERVFKAKDSSSVEQNKNQFTYSNNEITEHYANCVRLSAENKINAKNAFGLHLIDYFSLVIQENTDYQIMTSALDASVKIYAGRVDAVYNQSHKVLVGIHSKKQPQNGSEDENETVETERQTEELERKITAKKKTKKKSMVELNLKNISDNYDNETNYFSNTLKSTIMCVDTECDTINDLIWKTAHVENYGDSVINPKDQFIVISNQNFPKEEIRDLRELVCFDLAHYTFGTSLANFDFTGIELAEELIEGLRPKLPDSQYSTHSVYEDMVENQDDIFRVDIANDTIVADVTEIPRSPVKTGMSAPSYNYNISPSKIDKILNIITSEPSEYSYFDRRLLTKLHGVSHVGTRHMRDPCSIASAPKKKVSKMAMLIDFTTKVDMKEFYNNKRRSNVSCLTAMMKPSEVQKYSNCYNMLSKQPVFRAVELFQFDSNNSRFMFEKGVIADTILGGEERNEEDPHSTVNGSDFDPIMNLDSVDLAGNDNEFIFSPTQNVAQQSFNLVDNPNKVARLDISFTKSSRKVNMDRLKHVLFEQIKTEKVGMVGIYDTVLSNLPESTRLNMSPSMLFVTALHLAGEGRIHITTNDNFKDVTLMKI